VYVMLHAIFPSIARIKNTMGPASALTSAGMIGFILFWLITCCFLVVPVPKMKSLVYAKLVAFIISAVAMLGWTVGKAGGLGPVASQGSTVHGSEKTWLVSRVYPLAWSILAHHPEVTLIEVIVQIVRFLMLGAANCATFASNASGRFSDILLQQRTAELI
jgi:nucleobase:cation symporter-1, NCS1 family